VVSSSSKLFTKTRTKEKEIPQQPNLVSLQLRAAMGQERAPNSLQPKFSTAKFGEECKGMEEEEGEGRRRGGAPPEPSCLFSYLSVALVGR
jgi:hypothetical protein